MLKSKELTLSSSDSTVFRILPGNLDKHRGEDVSCDPCTTFLLALTFQQVSECTHTGIHGFPVSNRSLLET